MKTCIGDMYDGGYIRSEAGKEEEAEGPPQLAAQAPLNHSLVGKPVCIHKKYLNNILLFS